MNQKKLMMIMATTTIMVMLLVPMLASQLAIAATYNSEYMTVEGVLDTDTYVLWPFDDSESLNIGFSKYGEMIDRNTKTGLEYSDTDPFAGDPAAVAEYEWVEGWIMDITYESGGQYKNVWAFALHSDYYNASSIGGPWQEGVAVNPTDISVLGGRKTSGGAVTDPICVLYDGPRRFVGLCHTIIYEDVAHNYPLMDLKITIVFNKVKKMVVLYKDFKRLDNRKSTGDMQIEFSERGEWDLGAGAPPKSYANIFPYQSTVYDHHYQGWYNNAPSGFDGTYDVLQIIDDDMEYAAWAAWWPKPITSWVEAIHLIGRDTILNTMSTHEETWIGDGDTRMFMIQDYQPMAEPTDNTTGNWKENPMVFVDDIIRVEGTHYDYNVAGNYITFYPAYTPPDDSVVKAVYKVDASQWDMSEEVGVPFSNAEWCCVMDETTDMFRAVTVYGVNDYNDGLDNEMVGVFTDMLDSEVQFYLDETFNPYDLNDAVHKDTRRWVVKSTFSGSSITLPMAPMDPSLPDWDAYCTFAERVLVNGVLQVPLRAGRSTWDYYLTVSPTTGKGTINFRTSKSRVALKVLYSTKPMWSDGGTIDLPDVVTNFANTSGAISMTNVTSDSGVIAGPDPLNLEIDYRLSGFNPTINVYEQIDSVSFLETLRISHRVQIEDFKVLYDPNAVEVTIDDDADLAGWTYDTVIENGTYFDMSVPSLWTGWIEFNALSESTVVQYASFQLNLDVTVYRNVTASGWWTNVTVSPTIDFAYTARQMGAYEWMVVGKDAATIDSAGAAYMTQAFDSKKQIHVQVTGLDIKDEMWGPEVPNVMAGATTGTRTDYYYDYPTDMRCGLHDDWCTTWPVASSNMLFSGGPRANLGTEYFNEFTMAFYASNEWVVNNTGHQDEILALSCWWKHSYGSGYATISVYKDLNGTIGFLIWGVDGQDTYYATKWFWDTGIYYLQQENDGVTDIILEIDYTDHPATITIVERLGTISHKEQHDP
jgi:hypothetical protein